MSKDQEPAPPAAPPYEQRNYTPAAPQGNHQPETGQTTQPTKETDG